MVEGIYELILKTPMGAKKGELVLKVDGGSLNGSIIVKGKENPFEGGTVDGDSFTFSGELNSSVGKMAYDTHGIVDGDTLTGEAKAKKGTLKLNGKRK